MEIFRPKVSIITCAYNSAATIKDTLESVAGQNYSNIEHILIDGCSKDETMSIIKGFNHNIRAISEPDKGIYDAMNKGIQIATGDIVAILNSDDYYENADVVSDIVSLFQSSGVDTIYADLQYVDPQKTDRVVRKWHSGTYHPKSFLYGWMPPHPTFFAKRDLFEQYGLYDLSMGTASDYELMLRFLVKFECSTAYLNKTIVKMRAGGASNNSIQARFKANKMDRLAWEKNGLKPYIFTTWLKPMRKIIQYFS